MKGSNGWVDGGARDIQVVINSTYLAIHETKKYIYQVSSNSHLVGVDGRRVDYRHGEGWFEGKSSEGTPQNTSDVPNFEMDHEGKNVPS